MQSYFLFQFIIHISISVQTMLQQQMLSLSIVIFSAILASVALFFLLGSNLHEKKKQNILATVGGLILLSIIISCFKSNQLSFSLFSSGPSFNIFHSELANYASKYPLDPKVVGDYLYEKNYFLEFDAQEYRQNILYISKKNEGASFYLFQLAQKLKKSGKPTFYIKIDSPFGSSNQFLRKTGFDDYLSLKTLIDSELHKNIKPFILIDNPELLQDQIWDILYGYQQLYGPHLILNTENCLLLIQKMNKMDKNVRSEQSNLFLSSFQIQYFVGADQSILQKLSPQNSYSRKLPINFQYISLLKNGVTEEEILLKTTNINSNVAGFFGISNHYSQVKKLAERGGRTSIGRLRQSQIPIQYIEQMEKLRLIKIFNGEVTVQ